MIEFQNVEIKYNDFVAVEAMNFTVKEGEFFTLLGPSGCGKTTTLRSLVGFIIPSKGKIMVGGKDMTHLPVEQRKIGIVFQSYALFPTMSVYENIAFGLKVQKLPKDEIHRIITEMANKVDLNEQQLNKNVSELSGGQQQRVAIARALVLKPNILVLDEPLSNLDAKLRGQMRAELKRLQNDFGITTIYVTHDQEEALTLSDRIAVYNKGKIEQIGTPHEIYNKSGSRFVCEFIGDINRLNEPVLRQINQQTGRQFDLSKPGYIRLERISLSLPPAIHKPVCLKARVVENEFNGIYTKYTYDVDGVLIRNVEKNDGSMSYINGQEISLFLNADDIMQF
ncbi:ABC transporter ATP-binding protein [Paenibacillus prosopidis]|uniref:Iron(III) transport system ATP-binding protein n=1 Tax=Paenibacillus prosopidis TaxID=630520 RepID=A0A368W601_9BACL|nr:ABC transporter ATP-binding protein [Paenibacillus prosopidis]RCW49163.1 iron(III) transport system ATP-binding protein [Paenibacillus prosopidis]